MNNKTVIEGNCVTPNGIIRQQIEIDLTSQEITKVANNITTTPNLITTDNDLIFPGFIDIHIHAREDVTGKLNYKEDFRSTSQAALNGGVIACMDMPNNHCPPIDLRSWQDKIKLIKQKSSIEIIPYVGIGPDTYPIHGYTLPYKVYMGPSIGQLYFSNEEQLDTVLARYGGKHISFHCEDPIILQHYKDEPHHHQRRPEQAEVRAIEAAIRLTKKYQLKTIICHLSTKKGLQLCQAARKEGVDLKVEVAPHHLYFDTTMLTAENSNLLQVNPPLRLPEDRQYLLEQLKKGNIDFLATDHAPHTLEEKRSGLSGLTGLDTFGLIVGDLMAKHHINPQILLKMTATNPGEFISQFSTKKFGQLQPGFMGPLTIIHGAQEWDLQPHHLQTKNQHNPFINYHFTTHTSIFPNRGEPNERSS